MTFKKWLRKIALFPFSIIMGIPDDFSADTLREIAGPEEKPLNERIMAFAGNPDAQFMSTNLEAAASEDDAVDADQQGNQGEDTNEGLDTLSDEDNQDADSDDLEDADDSNGQETEETGTEEKGTKKRKFEDRVAEVAQKLVEAELAKRDKAVIAEKPDWTPIDQAKVDEYIAEIEVQIDDLRLEGKYTEARKLSRKLDQLDADLEANEAKRQAWEAKQTEKKTTGDTGEATRAELDKAAELYRKEMKIDSAVWDKMGEWFNTQLASKPLIAEEFNDIFKRNGKVAAIRFAHEYTVKNMNSNVRKLNEKREQSKTKASSLTASTTGKAAPIDLKKAQAAFAADPSPENFAQFQNLKRQAQA